MHCSLYYICKNIVTPCRLIISYDWQNLCPIGIFQTRIVGIRIFRRATPNVVKKNYHKKNDVTNITSTTASGAGTFQAARLVSNEDDISIFFNDAPSFRQGGAWHFVREFTDIRPVPARASTPIQEENQHMPQSFTRRQSVLTTALLAGSILAGGLIPFTAQAAPAPEPLQLAPVATQTGFAALAAKVRPAVVNIATQEMRRQVDKRDMPELPPGSPFADMFKQFFDQQNARPEHALGSGFLIDPAGYIVTNNHVVDGAHKITAEVLRFIQHLRANDPERDVGQLTEDIAAHFGLAVHRRTVERALARSKKKRP